MKNYSRYAVKQQIEGEKGLLYSEDINYFTEPEDLDFEPMLARDMSSRGQDFVLKGVVKDKIFYVTDLVYHGEFYANKPWHERYLELKKGFDYTPSVRLCGAMVGDSVEEALELCKAYSYSPHFDGVRIEGYSSDMYDDRINIGKDEIMEMRNNG